MGCDIHLHIEMKLNGRWEHWSHPRVNRDYRLFEAMAGVRGELKYAVKAPCGLPEDCNAVTLLDHKCWEGDAHTESYLDGDALQEIIDRFEVGLATPFGWFLGDGFRVLLGYDFETKRYAEEDDGEGLPTEIEDIRFVFWFDN